MWSRTFETIVVVGSSLCLYGVVPAAYRAGFILHVVSTAALIRSEHTRTGQHARATPAGNLPRLCLARHDGDPGASGPAGLTLAGVSFGGGCPTRPLWGSPMVRFLVHLSLDVLVEPILESRVLATREAFKYAAHKMTAPLCAAVTSPELYWGQMLPILQTYLELRRVGEYSVLRASQFASSHLDSCGEPGSLMT